MDFKAKIDHQKKVTFKDRREYVTSHPVISDLSNKLLRTLEKMESQLNLKDRSIIDQENGFTIKSGYKPIDHYEPEPGYHDDFEIPKHDQFASATKGLIDQAQAIVDNKTDQSSLFVRSDQSVLNNILFENFNRELQNEILITPTKLKQIEETYLNENFETIKKRIAKKNEVPFLNPMQIIEDLSKFHMTEDQILDNIIGEKIKAEIPDQVGDLLDKKIEGFLEALKGLKIDGTRIENLRRLKEADDEMKLKKRAELIAKSSSNRQQFKTDQNFPSSERIGPGFDGMDYEIDQIGKDLEIIRETMREELGSENLANLFSNTQSWSRIGDKGKFIRFDNRCRNHLRSNKGFRKLLQKQSQKEKR